MELPPIICPIVHRPKILILSVSSPTLDLPLDQTVLVDESMSVQGDTAEPTSRATKLATDGIHSINLDICHPAMNGISSHRSRAIDEIMDDAVLA